MNAISRKLQGFEQPYLEAGIAMPQSTLTAPNYRVKNIEIFKLSKNLKKSEKLACKVERFKYSFYTIEIKIS